MAYEQRRHYFLSKKRFNQVHVIKIVLLAVKPLDNRSQVITRFSQYKVLDQSSSASSCLAKASETIQYFLPELMIGS